jgi:hypothetical protein
MKKLNFFISFNIFFVIMFLISVMRVNADIAPNPNRHRNEHNVIREKIQNPDTNVINSDTPSGKTNTFDNKNDTIHYEIDTLKEKQIRGNAGFFELIQPKHLAFGGAALIVVIFSFVVLSKIRSKK